jgi:hypothetical protein
MTTDKGFIFDVQDFARFCIKIMENLILFTQNETIR